jgi:hypothetical protein
MYSYIVQYVCIVCVYVYICMYVCMYVGVVVISVRSTFGYVVMALKGSLCPIAGNNLHDSGTDKVRCILCMYVLYVCTVKT